MRPSHGLAELIRPLDVDTFENEYYGRRPLVVSGAEAGPRKYPLELTDIDQILATSSLRSNDLRIVNQGRETPISELAAPGDSTGLEALYEHYRNGSTIVFKFLNERWTPLAELCRGLADDLDCRTQVNVYLTPTGARGLMPHFDTHDVFVLQVSGTKHWRLYDSPYPLPLHGQTMAAFGPPGGPGEPTEEFDLRPGDLMYLPRGYVHDATSADNASLHLTIGLLPALWADVVREAVQHALEHDVRFREALPRGFADDPDVLARGADHLRSLLAGLADNIPATELLGRAARRADLGRQPNLLGHLLDLEAVRELDGNTRVRRRSPLACRVHEDAAAVRLEFHGKEVRLPSRVSEQVRFVLNTDTAFTANELPAGLDAAGRSVLIGTLLREGLLTVV